MYLFSRCWAALRAVVGDLPDQAFAEPGRPPTGEDPLDALTGRLAAAYGDPSLLQFHLEDVGAAAGRAAELCDPGLRVSTRGEVLTAGDYLSAYVLEWTLHHLDLTARLPGATKPPDEGLAVSRGMLGDIAGTPFPESFSDERVAPVGVRRLPIRQPRRRSGRQRRPFLAQSTDSGPS